MVVDFLHSSSIVPPPDNLEEDSKYEVKVEARNDRGWSGQAQLARFFTRNIGEEC